MSEQQTPSNGDWRKGGYRDAYERVPRAPRKPTPIARDLIYGYHGSQSVLRIIGTIFLLLGIPLMLFLGDGAITDLTLSVSGKTTTATVVSTRVVTNVEVNDVHPVEINYQYEAEGQKYTGASYTTNGMILNTLMTGTSISIEMVPSLPSWSRMKGTTSSKMGAWVLFFLIFPFVGGGLLYSAVRSNRREIRAFRDGTAIKGLVVKRAFDTTTEVNGQNPYEISWEFQVDGTMYKGKLSHMDRAVLDRALPDEEVTVLYDQRDPNVNTVWLE